MIKPRISDRYSHFIFSVVQSGITCAVAAAISTAQASTGGDLLKQWFHAFIVSWGVMVPIVIVAAPLVRGVVRRVTR
jgi:hypothetical protein